MILSRPQIKALAALTDRWQTARKLHARTNTMKTLVAHGHAERDAIDGFNTFKLVRYRRSQSLWSEERVLQILTSTFPQWAWEVKQESLIIALKVSRGIVSFGHNVGCEDIKTDDDVKRHAGIAIEGLRDALGRWGRGNDENTSSMEKQCNKVQDRRYS